MAMELSDMLSVVGLGIATVFVGLIAIILLCKIVSFCCNGGSEKSDTKIEVPSPVAVPQQIENRQEIIAAVSVAIAEELGTDVSALRILSFKKN